MILGRLLALWEAGARVVVATDAGIGPGKPHDFMAYAVLQLAAATRDPVGALRAATSQAADALGLADSCGRLAPGRCADLLVVRGQAGTDVGALWTSRPSTAKEHVAGPSSRPRPPGWPTPADRSEPSAAHDVQPLATPTRNTTNR